VPQIDYEHPTYSVDEQKAYYEKKGIVFIDDEWSLWHIRVWANAREPYGFGITINANIVFTYAEKFGMDAIDTLERVKRMEKGTSSE